MRLQDKVIAITGSGSGLGRECALLFAQEGARIVTSDVVAGRAHNVAKEVEAAGGHAVGIDADVRSEPDMERLVRTTVEAFGRIDVMFANAGIPEPGFGAGRLEDLTLDDWNNIVATNLTGIFLAFKHAARAMIAQGGGGTLLATTSASAFNAYTGFPAYGASKAGGNGFIRGASLEWGKHGIRANALCPTHGMSVNFAMPPEADVLGKSYEEMAPWDPSKRAMPLKLDRPPTLRDNAFLALFLASDESAYMSGQCIQATDGGSFARTSIILPADLAGDDAPGAVLPPELQQQVQ
jgi:NAD(P)-dependent dehydrogenase (short-subunit alcohol dehydrogenase family)